MVLVYLFLLLLLLLSTFFPHWELIKLSKSKGSAKKNSRWTAKCAVPLQRPYMNINETRMLCISLTHVNLWPVKTLSIHQVNLSWIVSSCHQLLLLLLIYVVYLHYPEFNKVAILILNPFWNPSVNIFTVRKAWLHKPVNCCTASISNQNDEIFVIAGLTISVQCHSSCHCASSLIA